MSVSANIGPSIRIKGEVTSQEPLTIAGEVDGSISVEGHPLTIAEGAHVNATVSADTIVIAGKVNGLLSADARIVVSNTAHIEGDLAAPAIRLTDGATVHGRIETTAERKAKLQLAS
jgi:cytoskeletal protein CcmA (bactofilin family)